jgi:hypothetical protein
MCPNCNSKEKTLTLLLESVDIIDKKRIAMEQVLECDIEGFFPIEDKLNEIGADILGIDLMSDMGDRYIYIFYDFVFGKLKLEEAVKELMELTNEIE